MQILDHRSLASTDGTLLEDEESDSEGMAINRAGEIFLSFERNHRVARLNPSTGTTEALPTHDDFANFSVNSGMEALAVHPDGTLYTLPERAPKGSATFPLFAYAQGQWRNTHNIPRRGPFRPVGADFGPNGLLYLLERAITPLGFRSRIRRFDLRAAHLHEQTLLTTLPARFDNMEAISLWQTHQGETRITLISDDNFYRIQRTQIVEFALTE